MKTNKTIKRVALLGMMLGMAALTTNAQTTYTWTGTTDSSWDTATANWDLGAWVNSTVGTAPTRATFNAAQAGTITVTEDGIALQAVTINGDYTFNGGSIRLTMTNNDPSAGNVIFNLGANSTVTINNRLEYIGTGQPFSTHAFSLGNGSTLNLNGGGSFNYNTQGYQWNIFGDATTNLTGAYTGISTFQASGTVNHNNATINGDLALGVNNNATYTINHADAALTSNQITIGSAVGAFSTWRTSQLNLVSGTVTSAWHLTVGGTSYTAAEFNVTGGVTRVTGNTTTNGIHLLSRTGGANEQTAVFNLGGGTVTTSFIDFGGWSSTDTGVAANTNSTAALKVTGGALYLGLNNNNVKEGLYLGKLDASSATIELGGGTLGAVQNWTSSMNMTLTGSNGDINIKAADEANTARNITLNGVLSGEGGLVKSGGGTLLLGGANVYTGNTVVSSGALTLDTGASLLFKLDAIGGINTLANTGGIVTLNGSINIDVADYATGDTWDLFDGTIGLGESFSVTGWQQEADGLWSLGTNWSFDQVSGLLTVIPEPSTWAMLGIGAALLAITRRRKR
jgi:autotransporter-associated beta strand protein